MDKYDSVNHIPSALYAERFSELLETVRKHGVQIDSAWLTEWVVTRHRRLCEMPCDLFASQDGFAEVEYVLREDLQNLLSPR